MEKRVINNKKYYVAYKGFKNDSLRNYQNNFTYKPNKLYKALDVDMSDDDCSYGLNLFQDMYSCAEFFGNICIIHECLVPLDDNKIKFIEDKSKFRCLKFYMTDKVVYDTYNKSWFKDYKEEWNELTEDQKDCICINNFNFNIYKYWNKLTEYQKDLVCKYNLNIDIDKYWNELTERQKDLVCKYNPNIDIDKYWNELTEDQKNLIRKNKVRNVVLEEEYKF